MGKWLGFWLSEEIAQVKAFRNTLNPNGKAYKEISALIEKAEAEEDENEDNK